MTTNKTFGESTKYPKIYTSYWSKFKIDDIHNKYESFKDIFENRNKFVEDYNLQLKQKKEGIKLRRYLNYLKFFKKRDYIIDHLECYKLNDNDNGEYILLNSPYIRDDSEDEAKIINNGWEKIYNLYGSGTRSYIKKISKFDFKNYTKNYNYSVCFFAS